MLILGLDPGYAITGFALLSTERGEAKLLRCGVLRTAAGLPLEERLLQIGQDLGALVERFSPEVMVVEELFFSKNVTTAMGVSQARGVMLYIGAQHGLPIHSYTPMQVKQAVTGYGLANKTQVMAMTKRLLHLSALPKPDDAADAVAIALCHARSQSSKLAAAKLSSSGVYRTKKGL